MLFSSSSPNPATPADSNASGREKLFEPPSADFLKKSVKKQKAMGDRLIEGSA